MLLTTEEIENLVMALAGGMETFTQDDAMKAIKWAESVRFNNGILEAVLNGKMVIKSVNGDEPSFALTEEGVREAEALVREARENENDS